MINLRNVFLISSVCVVTTVFCSEQQVLSPEKLDAQVNLQTVSLAVDGENDESVGKGDSSKDSRKASTSSVFTKSWYGIAKHVGGKTAYATFMELYDKGTLKADYDENQSEPMNRFNEAVTERFTKKDLLAKDKQEKIHLLLANAHKIDKEFVLAKALASTYLIIQQGAVKEILENQAFVVEPQLKKERDDAIAKAHHEYNGALSQELQHASNATANFRYLYKHAQAKGEVTHEKKEHYASSEKYLQLLESIRENKQSAVSK